MIDIQNMDEPEILKRIQKMSDEELHLSAVQTAETERKITLALLRHLNEIDRRHLYSKFSASSLHAYCVKELKFDDGGAGRRVSAARLLRDVPLIEEKILSGAVTLTSVAQAGIFFRKENKAGNKFTINAKRDVILELENKSTREVDRILISKSNQPDIHLQEKITAKTSTFTEVRLYFDNETMVALNRLKEIWSHVNPHASLADVIKRAAREAVANHDPVKKIARDPTSAPEYRASKASVRRQVWARDEGACTFVNSKSGERCLAKHFIEEDHILPKAKGGAYTVENMRLRCRAHNQRHAIDVYGFEKMREYLIAKERH